MNIDNPRSVLPLIDTHPSLASFPLPWISKIGDGRTQLRHRTIVTTMASGSCHDGLTPRRVRWFRTNSCKSTGWCQGNLRRTWLVELKEIGCWHIPGCPRDIQRPWGRKITNRGEPVNGVVFRGIFPKKICRLMLCQRSGGSAVQTLSRMGSLPSPAGSGANSCPTETALCGGLITLGMLVQSRLRFRKNFGGFQASPPRH